MLSPSVPSLSLILRGIATSARCDINCHRTSIARIGRLTYTRTYPVVLVQSDGSTINIRYHEPRKIIKVLEYIVKIML
ncbi:39S ribosomal protein L55, mitochondrial [Portunus trituberculatus]|uniref:39S ribosomal protein L55, mitochondrial n=1 Tax=Portunus trituberculatus TaxID=210409 RepID=A0A5B7JKA9_PORTR|nr:39S ribosomal protein L55, mitochondrial [Portunus trituberculatus]